MSGGVRDCNSCHVRVRFQSRRSTAIVEDLDAAAAGGGVYSSRSRLDGGGGHECLAQFFDPRGMFNLFWLCIQGGPKNGDGASGKAIAIWEFVVCWMNTPSRWDHTTCRSK